MNLNPYEPPEVPPVTVAPKGPNWTLTRVWLVICGLCWILAGLYWASMELIFPVILGLPLWLCFMATFVRIKVTRTTYFGASSAIATSTVALLIWLGFCEFVRTGHNDPARGPVGDGLVMLLVVVSSALILLPFVAWVFSERIESENEPQ